MATVHDHMIAEWQLAPDGRPTSFLGQLLKAYSTADSENRTKLAVTFPEVKAAFEYWATGEWEKNR